MTRRQLAILDIVYDHVKRNRFPPSLKEIGGLLNISTITVHEHLHALQKKGVVSIQRHSARSVRIIDREYLASKADYNMSRDVLDVVERMIKVGTNRDELVALANRIKSHLNGEI